MSFFIEMKLNIIGSTELHALNCHSAGEKIYIFLKRDTAIID